MPSVLYLMWKPSFNGACWVCNNIVCMNKLMICGSPCGTSNFSHGNSTTLCLLVTAQRRICANRICHSLGWCEACDWEHDKKASRLGSRGREILDINQYNLMRLRIITFRLVKLKNYVLGVLAWMFICSLTKMHAIMMQYWIIYDIQEGSFGDGPKSIKTALCLFNNKLLKWRETQTSCLYPHSSCLTFDKGEYSCNQTRMRLRLGP